MSGAYAPLPLDDPRMIAWEAFKASPEYPNIAHWAANMRYVDGSLWQAFLGGWSAHAAALATPPEPQGEAPGRRRTDAVAEWLRGEIGQFMRDATGEWHTDEVAELSARLLARLRAEPAAREGEAWRKACMDTGIQGIYDEFRDAADAIRQLGQYIREAEEACGPCEWEGLSLSGRIQALRAGRVTPTLRRTHGERLFEDAETLEQVTVIGELVAPCKSRKGEPREAIALVLAAPGCYHADVLAAIAPPAPTQREAPGAEGERNDYAVTLLRAARNALDDWPNPAMDGMSRRRAAMVRRIDAFVAKRPYPAASAPSDDVATPETGYADVGERVVAVLRGFASGKNATDEAALESFAEHIIALVQHG